MRNSHNCVRAAIMVTSNRRTMRSLAVLMFLVASATGQQSMSFPDGEVGGSGIADNGTTSGGAGSGNRSGKNLFNWLGSFSDEGADPYLSSANGACLQGDMAECFKARALSGLGDFFVRDSYRLNENVRVVRLRDEDDDGGRHASRAFEFSTDQRPEDTEWDKLVKFATRKAERFLRSAAVEVHVPDELTEGGRYSPRFIDEISSELDTLEDKKASVITKKKVKKLLIPLLIVLKLFKLKLLLFLPLILGLASFKKVLGFLALVVPGLIGFFKLCKPDLQHNYGTFGHSSYYHRPSNGGGPLPQTGPVYSPFREHQESQYHREQPQYFREHPVDPQQYLYESADAQPYNSRPARNQQDVKVPSTGSVAFKDEANDMAYNGYNRQQRR
ncbi:uncharacterized protein LOC112593447 [Melanaphis sacchari]|uniref:uncharacterized protein LOC112593447 n=1 Tax=Melanaphis sacchari TaxID=742174 RepID=UPI000DC13C28|nr:uncharacterized protein LOC112593447 [Melanaphis sacchari]XP_025193631.1 uncharacterized protein LOC112593447 [Melanaphis sacchari]XP_025193637.1 uncharacterized protein LOC112593447 [Melanaphis sacchari]XP_025193644.1 uncharacterized protein LOC112593447 [Melanaphis sacchari]XP_025193650.1 uncharacterized protein LOC112593447 [Melanaphis sacchari]